MTSRKIDPPICVALDTEDLALAEQWIDALAGIVPVFKVGLQLFTAAGPPAVRAVLGRGAQVFLDLKLNDIPNTVAGAVRSAASLNSTYLTVHGNAGRASVRAAIDAAAGSDLKLLIVSVLTSLSDTDVRELGVDRGLSPQVDAMAELATTEGTFGITLAATEVARVRAAHPDLFLLVPGIRPAGVEVGDQKQVGTPGPTVRDGADLIVLGRAVTSAPDPAVAVKEIAEEIAQAVETS